MTSEEDGTQYRATKVKTKKGSNDKNIINKTSFQKRHPQQPAPTSPEYLTVKTFSAISLATFKNMNKRLLVYATLKYGHHMVQAVQTRQPKTFSRLAKPSDDDIDDYPDGANYWWQD